jgi:L,D-peptidoglycan transpeptidase YkuD (ErfK/YbiS/YcfS/YnhG family)
MKCVAAVLFIALTTPATAQTCPDFMTAARRLVVVTAPDMNTTAATLQTFVRVRGKGKWAKRSEPLDTVIGKSGMAWGLPYSETSPEGEPKKTEGDKRTPAGFFQLGRTFGTDKSGRVDYLRLRKDRHICVDDLNSKLYGSIVPRSEAGAGVSGEDMWAEPLYKRGIIIDAPVSRETKSGSCIFMHVRDPDGSGTSGCVAVGEREIEKLQEWVSGGDAVIAILSEGARQRFAACLP